MSTYESRYMNAELQRQDDIRAHAHELLRFLGQALTLRMAAKKVYDSPAIPADSPISDILGEFINGIEAAGAEAHARLEALENGRYADELPALPGVGMQPFFDKLTGGR